MTMSRILMEPRVFTFFVSSSTLTTLMRWRLSCATTSSRDGASIVADLSSPFTARAVYVNVGIVVVSLGISVLQVGSGKQGTGNRSSAWSYSSPFPVPRSLPSGSTSFLLQPTGQRGPFPFLAADFFKWHAADHP